MSPIIECAVEDSLIWRISWNGPNLLLGGCMDGSACLFDFQGHYGQNTTEVIQPALYFPLHDSAIRDLTWMPDPDDINGEAHLFMTVSFDGRLLLTDIRDPFSSISLYRMRAFQTACAYTPSFNMFSFVDADNNLRCVQLSYLSENVKFNDEESTISYGSAAFAAHETFVWVQLSLVIMSLQCSRCHCHIFINTVRARVPTARCALQTLSVSIQDHVYVHIFLTTQLTDE